MGPGVAAPGLWSAGSVVVAYGLSCSEAYGIFPEQGLKLCPLHRQADSYRGATREAPEQLMTFEEQLGD